MQRTYNRIARLIPHERIYIETNSAYAEEFLSQLPELSSDRLILEPSAKGTAPAVGLAAAVLHKLDPEAVMVNVWADHFYDDEDGYLKMVELTAQAVEKYPHLMIGMQAVPTYPATGFGYIEAGEKLDEFGEASLYKATRFVEKPDEAKATEYLAAGNYYWNTANFVWRVDTLLSMYKEFLPELHAALLRSADAWGTPEWNKVVAAEWEKLNGPILIEYEVFEKTPDMALIPTRVGWKDVGTWQVVHEMLSMIEGNGVVAKGKVITVEAENSLIFNENEGKLVAVVGVDDLVVVDTHDALLVMRKSRDQDVKKAIAKIIEMGEQQHL